MRVSRGIAALCTALLAACRHAPPDTAPYDVVIQHGTVIDGSGAARQALDVAVRADRIVRIAGSIPATNARRIIDATGLIEDGSAGASESSFATSGGSASSGSAVITRATRSRTSLAASSMSRDRSNSIEMEERSSWLADRMLFMPSMPLT